MNKKAKYAIYAGIAGGVVNGFLNILKQNGEDSNLPINWSSVLHSVFKGAAVGSTAGFLAGAYVDHQNSLEEPINTDIQLGSLVKQFQLPKDDKKYMALCEKADWLILQIKKEFDSDLKGEPFRFGSTLDGTALREKYDIDISVSFKPDVFSSTFDMYEILFDFLKNMEGENGLVKIRKQTVSIGVFFDLGYYRKGKIDIVPIKITKSRGNKTSGYVHKKSQSIFSTHSYQKTDTLVLSNERLSVTQKKILVALKKWKANQHVPISSHLLQNLIIDAYAYNVTRIPSGLTNKIIMVMTHMRDNIDTIYLTSIENTNNVITNIPDNDKAVIREACKKVIEDFEYQSNSIVDYFC